MKKVKTMDLKGKDYAKVPERIKQFREDCPYGLIETTPTIQEGNVVMFTARILKDKKNEHSAEATGHSLGKLDGDKSFEKLETIAVGRALALLGYMASGEIASSEEMEEFIDQKEQKKLNLLLDLQAKVAEIDNLEDLKAFWTQHKGIGKEFDKMVTDHKLLILNNLKNEDTPSTTGNGGVDEPPKGKDDSVTRSGNRKQRKGSRIVLAKSNG